MKISKLVSDRLANIPHTSLLSFLPQWSYRFDHTSYFYCCERISLKMSNLTDLNLLKNLILKMSYFKIYLLQVRFIVFKEDDLSKITKPKTVTSEKLEVSKCLLNIPVTQQAKLIQQSETFKISIHITLRKINIIPINV